MVMSNHDLMRLLNKFNGEAEQQMKIIIEPNALSDKALIIIERLLDHEINSADVDNEGYLIEAFNGAIESCVERFGEDYYHWMRHTHPQYKLYEDCLDILWRLKQSCYEKPKARQMTVVK